MSDHIRNNKIPIVYSSYYNISFGGLERLHPFDSTKWKKVMTNLFVRSKNSDLKTSDNINVDSKDTNSARDPLKRKNSSSENQRFLTWDNSFRPVTENISTSEKREEIRTPGKTEEIPTPGETEEEIPTPVRFHNWGLETSNHKNFESTGSIATLNMSKDTQKRLSDEDTGQNQMEESNKDQVTTETGIIKQIIITEENIYEPYEATEDELRSGHTDAYLQKLKSRYEVAKIVEVPLVAVTPMFVTNRILLKKFRYHVGGTILAAKLALHYQWAINVGGGFHHASEDNGGGFCVYADISIAIKQLKKLFTDYKFMIIDLDAHQGNGHEIDFKHNKDVYIFDMYNEAIYPNDEDAKRGISLSVGLMSYTKDDTYLRLLQENLETCFQSFSPNLIIYNAGTNCLLGDPLGRLNITRQGIIDRDEMVFRKAKEIKCPIVMVTSGGYQISNADIIADSIWNLFVKRIIS